MNITKLVEFFCNSLLLLLKTNKYPNRIITYMHARVLNILRIICVILQV
jgi:hypothetical protein